MSRKLIDVGNGFWNIRGSFKIAGLIDIGTQISLIQRANGKFVFLDSYTLSDDLAAEIEQITGGSENVEAILNLHPFHTVHVQAMHQRYPKARLHGTARHVERFADLPWHDLRTEPGPLPVHVAMRHGTVMSLRGTASGTLFAAWLPHAEIRDYYGITGAVACTRGHDLVCSVVTPLKPYEAMAYARPVVVSDIPALREMVEDRVTGRLVRAEDPVALARVLEELADDPDERRALGARAAAWVREHRTWQRVADGYRPAYAYARDAFARRTQERP